MSAVGGKLARAWAGLRTLLGDDAYERYLRHCCSRHPDEEPLDRRTFHASELDRRWKQVNRCC